MTNHETDRRAQWANALWEAAEHHTIAEWICCDPINPKHGLCVAGGKALEMLRALIVDDPEAYKPAPLTTVALELAAAVSVPPPAPRADDQAALRDRIAERPERYAVAIHDAMESDLSLVDQEPGQQALFARAAEAVMALADSEQATLRRKLAAAEKIRENADFHLGQEMARRQLAEKEAARLSADQAAVLNAAAQHLYTALFPAVYDDMGQKAAEGVNRAVSELRRLADVAGPCVAGEQQNETPEAATVHAVPLPGSNGISSCCGRPPCEFVGERVTRDPDKVTCTGPTAGVRQNGTQP